MNAHIPDYPTRNPTPARRAIPAPIGQPDGPTAFSTAPVHDTHNTTRPRPQKISSRSVSTLPVGPSGAPIHAGFARRVARRVTRRASGASYSLTHLIKKLKGEGYEGSSHRSALAASVPGRLAMGSAAFEGRQPGLPAGGLDIPQDLQAKAGNVERVLVSQAAKPLRQSMPLVTAFIDDLRAAFGQPIVEAIKAGMAGQQTFYASENGQQVGTPIKNASPAPQRAACSSCQHWTRPGLSGGYCGAHRPDLTPAYSQGHPLRRLPQDGGAHCPHYSNESR